MLQKIVLNPWSEALSSTPRARVVKKVSHIQEIIRAMVKVRFFFKLRTPGSWENS